MVSAVLLIAMAMLGLWFVDDNNLLVLGQPNKTADQICAQLQALVSLWQTGLRMSGGALRPKKCLWSLLDFRMTSGKATITKKAATPGDIYVDGKAIKRLKPTKGVTAVGMPRLYPAQPRLSSS